MTSRCIPNEEIVTSGLESGEMYINNEHNNINKVKLFP
jgi:hypothetical protein